MKTAFKLTQYTLAVLAGLSIIYTGTLNARINDVLAKQVQKDFAAKVERNATIITPFAQVLLADVRGGK